METIKSKDNPIISLKLAKRTVSALIFVMIFEFFLFPAPIAVRTASAAVTVPTSVEVVYGEEIEQDFGKITKTAAFENTLPVNNDAKVIRSTYRTITSYNSEAAQCDSTPCITANGFNLCEHGIEDTIAANWLKFGTKVRIPELFGNRVFVVRDRMNKRYSDRVDIWMLDKQVARKFGVKIAKIEILEPWSF